MEEYCNRPKNFEEIIIRELKKIKMDVLIHLGDFCIGKDKYWHEQFMKILNCKKWLIRGNHDRKSDMWYSNQGWDWVGRYFQNRFFNKNVVFSHFPIRYTDCGRDSFDINIHGHFHNNLHKLLDGKFVVEGEKERNAIDLANLSLHHKLLSIEETNYKPVDLEKFIKKQ